MFYNKSIKEIQTEMEKISSDVEMLRETVMDIYKDQKESLKKADKRDAKERASIYAASRAMYEIKDSLADVAIWRLIDFLQERKESLETKKFQLELLILSLALEEASFSQLAAVLPDEVTAIADLLLEKESIDQLDVGEFAKDLRNWLGKTVWLDNRAEQLARIVAESRPSKEWLPTLERLRSSHTDNHKPIFDQAEDMLCGPSLFLRTDNFSVQRFMRECEIQILVVVLSQESTEVVDRMLGTMANRGEAMVREDIEYLGTAEPQDLEKARRVVAHLVRMLITEGKIFFGREYEELDDDEF
jgi:hypothetical protein